MKFKDTKYFGVKLSENRIINNKGQLIIKGCTFARTGLQKYHKSELDINEDGFIDLYRPVEEVSSKATIASFEGAPITEDHPKDDVKVGLNWSELTKGMAFNIKYVADSETEGHLTADLILTDAHMIEEVKNHRINELSAGYNCEIDDSKIPWTQRNILGNHIAIVENARAGHMAVIRDKKYSKTKVIRVGDKLVEVVGSYKYTLKLGDKKYSYIDYYGLNEDNEKILIKTEQIKNKREVIK